MIVAVIFGVVSLAVLSHTAPFPFLFDALYGKITVWRMPVQPGRKIVYLTFDDGPNPEKQANATFFLINNYVTVETAPIIRRACEEGHTIGQHSGDRCANRGNYYR